MDICIIFRVKINIFIELLAPQKFFCENSNGGSTRNAILSGNEKTVFKFDNCATDEWCAGAKTFGEGVNATAYKNLCQKGKILLFSRQLCETVSMKYWFISTTNNMKAIILIIHIEKVSCGKGHSSPSCSQCIFTDSWCNGECEFDWEDNQCKEIGKTTYICRKFPS